jgi:hypothetical protein
MGAAIGLRADFDAVVLRRLARATRSANQGRRLLAWRKFMMVGAAAMPRGLAA